MRLTRTCAYLGYVAFAILILTAARNLRGQRLWVALAQSEAPNTPNRSSATDGWPIDGGSRVGDGGGNRGGADGRRAPVLLAPSASPHRRGFVRVASSQSPPSSCDGTAFPARGVFDPATPPYWRPDDCPVLPTFSPAAWRACMARRGGGRLFVAGNSIGRGIAFSAADLLSNHTHHPDARLSQRDACAKSKARARHYENPHATNRLSCVIPVDTDGGAQADAVRFLWKPHAWSTTWFADDFCAGEDPRSCWRAFFGGEGEPDDVLLLQMGLAYPMTWRDEATPSATPAASPPLYPGPGRPDVPVQWNATRVADAVSDFTAFLDAGVFRGTVVWVSTPLTRATTAAHYSNYDKFNSAIDALNAAVGPALRARGVPVIDMRRFADGLNWNAAHVDAVHPPREHYDAVVHALARAVCPGTGRSSESRA